MFTYITDCISCVIKIGDFYLMGWNFTLVRVFFTWPSTKWLVVREAGKLRRIFFASSSYPILYFCLFIVLFTFVIIYPGGYGIIHLVRTYPYSRVLTSSLLVLMSSLVWLKLFTTGIQAYSFDSRAFYPCRNIIR